MKNSTTSTTSIELAGYTISMPMMATIKQLAAMNRKTGITEHCIRRWVVSGKVPSIRVGVKYLVSVSDFICFLKHATEADQAETEAQPDAEGGSKNGGGRIRRL